MTLIGIIRNSSYICNVFFIVLDLRLTIWGYSGSPFLFPLHADQSLELCRQQLLFSNGCSIFAIEGAMGFHCNREARKRGEGWKKRRLHWRVTA